MNKKVTKKLKIGIIIDEGGYISYSVDQSFMNGRDKTNLGGLHGNTCDTVEAFNEFLSKINTGYRIEV